MLKPDKTCPRCESDDYRFRGRKLLDAAVQTKYLCAACGHTWKVKVAATPATVPTVDPPPPWEVDTPENL